MFLQLQPKLLDQLKWTFARFVWAFLTTLLCVWEINGLVPITGHIVYMYHVFQWLAKKKITKKKARHRTDFSAAYD